MSRSIGRTRSSPGGVEAPHVVQRVAFGTVMPQREAAHPNTVAAAVVRCGWKAEMVHPEHAGETRLVDHRGFVSGPVLLGSVDAGHDERLLLHRDQRPHSVSGDGLGSPHRATAGQGAGRCGGTVEAAPAAKGAGSSGCLHEQGGLGVDIAEGPQGLPRLDVLQGVVVGLEQGGGAVSTLRLVVQGTE